MVAEARRLLFQLIEILSEYGFKLRKLQSFEITSTIQIVSESNHHEHTNGMNNRYFQDQKATLLDRHELVIPVTFLTPLTENLSQKNR